MLSGYSSTWSILVRYSFYNFYQKTMAFTAFLVGRLRSLKPTLDVPDSPFHLLGLLSAHQWLFFLCAFFAWTWDAFDYFSVSQVIGILPNDFGKSETAIALGLTASLIPRFVGAATFGLAADFLGRKWPFIINCVCLIIIEMALGFCKTYTQFIICRTLFGICMGGLYGNATATALEDCPERARGLVSGIYQCGYSTGWLLAIAFSKIFVDASSNTWKPLFWFGAGPPVLLIIFRLWLPETVVYQPNGASNEKGNIYGFLADFNTAVKLHWCLLCYLVAFMAGCAFLSHGSADIYGLMLSNKYDYSSERIRVTQIVGNLGAIVGSAVIGFGSQIVGRRFAITVACIMGAVLVYPYFFVSDYGLYAAVFFMQFMIQGIFGVVPIYLIELSPPAFRTFVVGTAYNLGILIASPIPVMDTKIGQHYPLPSKVQDGVIVRVFDYSIGMAISMACAFVYLIVMVFLGTENRRNGISDDEQVADEEEAGFDVTSPVMAHGKW